ncbi:hypothetical protein CYMTET_14565 [Cymbomonas tetramitiformis]|uniref:Uncharacterized protein n=1 Tax=Cymbomonas tetramitiformis TaxID=36881 RepID=A0AAE0GH98_9CHLO|nr:hypothetical protein CYMTET_14565 [Cymbomonas tetramitiformis]
MKHTQKMTDLREIASAESVEDIVLSYSTSLQNNPGLSPEHVNKLLSARTDISRADRTNAVAQCSEVRASRTAREPPSEEAASKLATPTSVLGAAFKWRSMTRTDTR